MDGRRFSSFYLMNVFIDYLGLPQTPYIQFLNEAVQKLPIYSVKRQVFHCSKTEAEQLEEKLQLLAYDRLLGHRYSLPEHSGEPV